ncbi:MAG: YggS family pyridoxal phosphate-dependent enzyme [Candidatus Sericytochromatia bacterium]
MATTPDIPARLALVQQRILAACKRVGREPESVRLILVSKTVAPERIRMALDAGATLLGENKAQELKQKAPLLQDTPARWHFIGHLQSNKIKDVLPWVEMIHSLDRLSLAQKLAERLETEPGRRLPVLIQVNTSYEASKSGVAPEQALELIRQVAALPALELRGLMTIGALSSDEQAVRACFRRLSALRADAEASLQTPLPELSMGMSGDFEIAIEEGSTLVRVGSAVFGERS